MGAVFQNNSLNIYSGQKKVVQIKKNNWPCIVVIALALGQRNNFNI